MCNYFHFCKFHIWDYARKNPTIGIPLRLLAKTATKNIYKNYKKRLFGNRDRILPDDRYSRNHKTFTQVWIVTKTGENDYSNIGLRLFLNHLRIPYREIDIKEVKDNIYERLSKSVLIIFCDIRLIDIPPFFLKKTSSCLIISLNNEKPDGRNYERINLKNNNLRKAYLIKQNFIYVEASFESLMPYADGLRSPLAAALVLIMLRYIPEPLITGMLPTQVGIRIDDVDGENITNYLEPVIAFGWKPNMGVFVDNLIKAEGRCHKYLAGLALENLAEFSPHAFKTNEFIYFDYSKGIPYTEKEFELRWKKSKYLFTEMGFEVSPVINSHFHVLSKSCYNNLMEDGLKYFFSEVAPDSLNIEPGKNCLPSGDPTCSTGQLRSNSILQLYSGDLALDCDQSSSLYDFLMHCDLWDKIDYSQPVSRILQRLSLSLKCGFPAFITTHEYLLCGLNKEVNEKIWDSVDSGLKEMGLGKIKKVSLSEIGSACADHTDTVIDFVENIETNKWNVRLSGKSRGNGYLNVFSNEQLNPIKIPPFQKSLTFEIEI